MVSDRLNNSHHFIIQLDVEPKPTVTCLHTFPRALRQLHVRVSSFDWFIGLSAPKVIGQSAYLGLTSLKWKLL